MTDVFSAKRRSEIMSRIRSTGTSVEEMLYRLVRRAIGQRWRIDRNARSLPGRPDIVIPTLKLAIFADGCFYHRCPEHGHVPRSNRKYWVPKLARNLQRDKMNRRMLRRLGFSVWAVWEHSLEGSRVERTGLMLKRRLTRLIGIWKCQA